MTLERESKSNQEGATTKFLRFVSALRFRPFFVSMIPVTLFLYPMHSMALGVSFWGLLDNAVYVLSFCFLFHLICILGNNKLKAGLLLLFVAVNILFFWGNLVYYRFFQGWVSLDTFRQYGDIPSITTAVWTLITWRDIVFMVFIPVVVCGIVLRNAGKSRWHRSSYPVPALIVVLFIVHGLWSGHNYNFNQINPLIDLPRQAFAKIRLRYLRSDIEKNSARYVKELYPLSELYRYAENERYPLMKVPAQPSQALLTHQGTRLNVVFILMESVRAFESGFYSKGSLTYTPNLDQLARSGLAFTNFYANGTQTVRGELSALSSVFPNYVGGPVYVNYPDLNLRSFPSILKDEGYRTLWISSYTSLYDNKRGFWAKNGIDTIVDRIPQAYLRSPQLGWGPADVDLFAYAVDVLDQLKKPFYAEIMTLSNHFEFDWDYPTNKFAPEAPGGRIYRGYTRGIYYTDYALGQFFEAARERPFFRNTIFVITSDHGIWSFPEDNLFSKARMEEVYFRAPLIIYAPEYIKPGVVDTIGSQVDIAPTLLDILGIRSPNSFMGLSLLRQLPKERMVLTMHDRRWNLRIGDVYCYDLGEKRFIEHFPGRQQETQLLKKEPHVCFESETDLLTPSGEQSSRILSEIEQRRLISRAERLLELNSYLLINNRIWPGLR